jgi:hypothetical protein
MTQDRDIQSLLRSYPRIRPALTSAHRALYVEEYRANRCGSSQLFSAVASLERWMHRVVTNPGGGALLEIGGGSLNHVRFERNVDEYDVIEPFHQLWHDSPERTKVRTFYDDMREVPDNVRYTRIISIAVLEHLENLPWVVARSATMLSTAGLFQAGFPSEGGLLWGLSWRLTTGIAYRLRTGLDYSVVMKHEHVNSAIEIITVVKYFFADVHFWRYPLPFHHLSFYTAVLAREPRLDRCHAFLSGTLTS